MQVALSGAWASGADWLILDEPSNHLDARHRQQLYERLQQWRGGLLVISHDRELLAHMQQIVELDARGLHRYGGPWQHYADARAAEREAAAAQLDHARAQHRQQQRSAREQHERQQQRQARGNRDAKQANQAPILLGRQKQRAEASHGRAQQVQAERLQASADQLRAAASAVHAAPELALFAGEGERGSARLLQAEALVLPHGCRAPLQLEIRRGQRIAVVGDNGSGKSTLLRVLAGQLPARSGAVQRHAPLALLDQQLLGLSGERSILDTVQAANPAPIPANCARGWPCSGWTHSASSGQPTPQRWRTGERRAGQRAVCRSRTAAVAAGRARQCAGSERVAGVGRTAGGVAGRAGDGQPRPAPAAGVASRRRCCR
jgi:ATPase subunit of ABC transporter with duplicated ATPase domains